jgi:3-oxoacyl-[acyl-carrier protein] reductase
LKEGFGCNNNEGVGRDRRKESTVELGLEGKVALVTGGSKGVGRGVAAALVVEGCHVCICSRDEEEVRRAGGEIEELGARGARVLAVAADLTDGADRQRLVEETLDELGAVDILVNNAGTVGEGERSKARRSRRGGTSSS